MYKGNWQQKIFFAHLKELSKFLQLFSTRKTHKKRDVRHLGYSRIYTRKNYELLKTGLNNVVLPILLIVVNNIEQVVEPESSPQSGVTMPNNIVDIIEQCGQHNIVQSCFQQPVTTYNFWLCTFLQHNKGPLVTSC